MTEKTNGNPVHVSTDFRGDFDIQNGDVAIASITSCTNTSNPSVMIAAGLIARNAVAKGIKPKPWVKTSLAPGSLVVADDLKQAGLQEDLDRLGYQLVGFGCATCIGNSGPLLPEISEAINANDLTVTAVLSGNRYFEGRISPDVKMNYLASPPLVIAYALAGTMANDLTVTAVLSGNRNFEGRISPDVKMNYLASPPLVIAYALAGTMDFDFETESLGTDPEGKPVYLKDIWPTNDEVEQVVSGNVSREMFLNDYASVFEGDARWKGLDVPEGELFAWDPESTYVRKQTFFDGMGAEPAPVEDIRDARVLAFRLDVPEGELFAWDPESTYVRKQTFFDGMGAEPAPVEDIRDARVLAFLGDSVTTDHISPAGAFKATSPAGEYLVEHGVQPKNFNSYGSRRGNHEVMVRGTFGNIRLRNMLLASVGEEIKPGHGTRHVRQHPPAQHAARVGGRGDQAGWLHLRLPGDEADDDLRGLTRLHRERHAARRHRRQGIRHRFLTRLGGEGHCDARCQGRHRRKLRAHPPFQPHRHGRAAAAVPRRRIGGIAWPERHRGLLDLRD